MSELNVYHHELRHNEYDEFYLKYEADKVIADLDESHKKEVKQLLIEIAEMKKACDAKDDWCLHTLKENRHHKYKRCLAMAKWCYSMGWFLQSDKQDFYWKWYPIWRELAEKFKPNKEAE